MTKFRLLIESILHYWRTNLAVMLGVVAGTAVIGGALIVGDSVRGSLRQMTFDRLGEIDHVLTGHRFFREQLADELANNESFKERYDAVAPALVLVGAMEAKSKDARKTDSGQPAAIRRVGQVNIYGVGELMWNLTDHGAVTRPENDEVILSHRVAEQLGVADGDSISLWIELPAAIPRDSLLGKRDESAIEIGLKVKTVLPEESRIGRLNLNPNQQLPFNAFVSLKTLQVELKLNRREIRNRKLRKIIIKPARINTLFVKAKSADDSSGDTAEKAADALNTALGKHVTLDDLYLRIERPERKGVPRGYFSLESEQQVLANEFGTVGRAAAGSLGMNVSPVLVYLGNEYANATSAKDYSRYSIVAGVDFQTMKQSPFGPLQFVGLAPKFPLAEKEILINEWLAKDLKIDKPGATLKLKYHVVGAHIVGENGKLPEETEEFTVAGIVKLDGTVADDRGITPRVEGITDADSFADWDKPFDMEPVTERDDDYWKKYGPTPKAFVSLATAQKFWSSRYGNLTSVRIAKRTDDKTLDDAERAFTAEFLSKLTPEQSGLFFRPVKFNGLQAAGGTTDFSALFLAFSFFLILSATILIGLLFRLGIERRSTGIGLLNAVGFSPRQVSRQFLAEGLAVVTLGGLLGTAAAWGYASVMIYGLKTWWVGAIGTRFLDVYVQPASLLIGFGSSVIVAGIAVWWAMRQTRKIATRDLLAGATEPPISVVGQRRRGRRAAITAIVSTATAVVLSVAALAGLIPAEEAFSGISWQVVAFFLVGILLLVAGLTALSWWLDSDKGAAVRGSGLVGIARLGARNASRHRQRSVLTVALIASATFVIVAVAAGHRNPAVEKPVKSSGNGGFTLVAESSTPILHDLNTAAGRRKLNLDLTRDAEIAVVQKRNDTAESLRRQKKLLEASSVISFQVKPGEDASCLNIYQTRIPTILGVPPAMVERGGFKFVGAKVDNTWTLLDVAEPDDGDVPVYPVLGDLNTLQYSLHKSVGAFISVPNDENPQYKLKIVGMFDGSVFQGVLLMSQANFQKLYPDRGGYSYFLVATPEGATAEETHETASQISSLFESRLNDYGFDAEPVADRLADFLAVQNTYLSTFQTLGGLGLLLGTLGLATVMLRNVLERRSELALLRAVGFRNGSISGMVLWENTVLLAWGLVAGTASALLAMTPHLASTGADVPWGAVVWILGGVFLVGTIAALLAVTEAVRTPIVATLRSE